MTNKAKTSKETLIVIISVTTFLIISIILIFIYNKSNQYKKSLGNEIYQTSLTIPGYELDKPFVLETYEYNVEVDMDQIQVLCDSIKSVSGCNEKISMKEKETYNHIVEIEDNGEIKKYTIHIKKKEKTKEEKIRITSVEGIPSEWTNKSVEIKVNIETEEAKKVEYSFDGGKNWQTSNVIKIEENKILEIIAKDEKENKTESKQIIINKIDKDKPKAEIIIESKDKDKIVIKAIGSDKTSEIDKYSFDGKAYSIVNTKEITKPGTYKVKVKDKAGNESEEQIIKIAENDFPKEDVKENEYKIELQSNGATINSSELKCKSYEETCKITLPKITRSGGTVIGWSTDKDSKKAEYKSGELISVKKDIKLYAITRKNLTATFEKNGATSIGSTSQSCTIYNKESSCNITSPTITRNGWTIEGWNTSSTSKSVIIKPNATLKISENMKYYAITSKIITATFEKNGASSIGATSKSCTIYDTKTNCNITTPTITRKGGTAIGWNTVSSAKTHTVLADSQITLNSNVKYYAITKKTITASFSNYLDKDAKLSFTSKSCTVYNTKNSCSIKFPYVTRVGKLIQGFYTNQAGSGIPPYLQDNSYNISDSTTYYVKTATARGTGVVRNPYKTTTITNIANAPNNTLVIEYDKECSGDLDSYITSLKRIYNKAPYLFRVHKIFLLNDTNFKATNGNSDAPGLEHGIAQAQAIDIQCSKLTTHTNREATLVHELAHSVDGYYELKNKTTINKTDKVQSLYNKYKNTATFSEYSKTSSLEFFADVYRHYYYTYLLSDDEKNARNKTVLEKYELNKSATNKKYASKSVYPQDVINMLKEYMGF